MDTQPGMLILPDFLIRRPGEPPLKRWGVRVLADRVDAIGAHDELIDRFPDDDPWRALGQTLSPGFVDVHSHLAYMVAHGLAGADPDNGFLDPRWWHTAADHITPQVLDAGLTSACVNALRTGITTVNDVVAAPAKMPDILSRVADTIRQRGIRAILSCLPSPSAPPASPRLALEATKKFLAHLAAAPKDAALVHGAVGIFLPNGQTSPDYDELATEAVRLAVEYETLLHVHGAPGTTTGEGSILPEALMSIGAPMLLAHCAPTANDWASAAPGRRALLSTPLADRRPRRALALLADKGSGMPVGLGSDGLTVDFFDVLRAAFMLYNANGLDKRLQPARLWYLATEGNARILGLNNIGRLEPGWQADLMLIDTNPPTPVTVDNLYSQLLRYGSRNRVQAVLVAGKMVVCEGVVLNVDLAGVRVRAHQAANQLQQAIDGHPGPC